MKKFAFLITLLAMMSIAVSCSKDDDGDNISKNSMDIGKEGNIYNAGKYEYFGTWKINGSAVVPDHLLGLLIESMSYIQNIDREFDYQPNSEGSSITTYITDDPRVSFDEFPIKRLVHSLFPEIDIACIVINYPMTGYHTLTDQWVFMEKINDQYRKEGDQSVKGGFLLSYLIPVGLSENTIYYELKSSDSSAYSHFTIVVTTKDENYFGLSFNLVPRKSVLVYDIQTEMVSLSLNMPSIDIINKDFTRTTRHLSPEYTITYNSNKVASHYVGN